ncbi:MAG: ATP-binding cassette domain-containing protein [Gammaproteobacteria bacterium]|nr:MAG: ATP-binding cassette domain-containing protein [Gammaproteobacteria bacterium]
MLVFSDLSLRRGKKTLLEGASFTIPPGQKVGITGSNGVGKSSLFSLILGEFEADTGSFSMPPDWVIAHVAQHIPGGNNPALDYVMQGDKEFIELQHKIDHATENEDGIALAELHSQMDIIDGYTAESRAATLMHGLGFKAKEIRRPLESFSGGWRMRLNLAQALMCRSDLLLLDEPTNHLDLDAVIWLQTWLSRYAGTLLLISHDREFLDSFITLIANIEHQQIALYTGHYSAFEKTRAEQLAQQQTAHVKQQKEIAHIESFVHRFGAKASKAKQAQSRVKALERMQLIAAAHVDSLFHFSFREPEKLPERLFDSREVELGYDDTALLKDVGVHLHAGDRIGLIGPNGAGKSTLIKFLAGKLKSLSGESWQAQCLKIGYFAQHQLEQLDAGQSALQHLRLLDKKTRESDLRGYLGGFGFIGDRVEEPAAHFSGGEKARLALALLIFQKPNLLLLDEPTNHLDLEMRHALSMALQEFSGAMVIVSHDRHLLKSVTDQLILVEHGKVVAFDGDLDDYANRLQAPSGETRAKTVVENSLSKKEARRLEADKRKKLLPLKKSVDRLERKIKELSKKIETIEQQLTDPELYNQENVENMASLMQDKAYLAKDVSELEEQWMESMDEYERAKKYSAL